MGRCEETAWTDGRDLETDSKPEIRIQIPPLHSFICSLEEGMRQELTGWTKSQNLCVYPQVQGQ